MNGGTNCCGSGIAGAGGVGGDTLNEVEGKVLALHLNGGILFSGSGMAGGATAIAGTLNAPAMKQIPPEVDHVMPGVSDAEQFCLATAEISTRNVLDATIEPI